MFNTIQIVKSSQTPLYLQLANGLSTFIENGQLPSETKLPSIRSLAKQLKINRDTVVSAYKILEQRRLVYAQTGRGTYVSSLTTFPVLETSPLEPFSLTHKDLINFSPISIPNDYFPLNGLEEITSSVLAHEKWNSFYDYDGAKQQDLLAEICSYFKDYSIQATPYQIRIIQGISQLIQALPKITGKTGICIESPSRDLSTFNQYGFQPFEIPLTKNGMDMEILEGCLKTGKIQYIYIMPYLQNPTGICYSKKNKLKLLALAKAYNVYIIENDIFSDLLLDDTLYKPLFSQSKDHNVIYIKYFSQLYLPSLHYIFVVFPITLANINITSSAYNFTDLILRYFLHNKVWQPTRQLLITSYQNKYLRLRDLIDLHLSSYISYSCTYGGIYIWLRLETSHISLKDLCDELLANHILISPGSLFFTDNADSPYLRLSIARVNMAQIEKGIKIMASILLGSKLK